MQNITYLKATDANFQDSFQEFLTGSSTNDQDIIAKSQLIIEDVIQNGDSALLKYTNEFDKGSFESAKELEIPLTAAKQAFDEISDEQRSALLHAKQRIEQYHKKQLQESWQYQDNEENTLGQQVTSIEKVGIYVPGGKASYPSSVLMNAIPAAIAGVSEIVMVVPSPGGVLNPLVLASAHIAGVTKIYTIGGAQAIAALAYGTDTIGAVNKIVGPGNAYVATAKRLVFGKVGIDMIAGPSEILIISDGSVDPKWLAADLMAQAEHDPQARAIFISTSEQDIENVLVAIDSLLPSLDRRTIISKSLSDNGLFIKVESLDQAIEVSNKIAPEHLELALEKADTYIEQITNAGAIFVGSYSCESMGDYCAGPNHTLPTSGTAAFSSPLGVYDFQKRSSIIQISENARDKLAATAAVLADGEGLGAHALAARLRLKR